MRVEVRRPAGTGYGACAAIAVSRARAPDLRTVERCRGITDFVNISHSFCEIFHRPNSAHPSIFALQDGTRGPAHLSTIPYWVVEARELAGTIVHPCLSIHLLMEREMKQRQYITTFSLIVALTGLSPVVVADVAGGKERPANSHSDPVPPQTIELTAHQMDAVTGGGAGLPPSVVKWLFKDVSGLVRQYHATCVANGGC